MDDFMFEEELKTGSRVIVSPIAPATYTDYVADDNLAGPDGYFIMLAGPKRVDVVAKARTFESALELIAHLRA